jgi:type II secretory pathway component GspD/PulD (secretin)
MIIVLQLQFPSQLLRVFAMLRFAALSAIVLCLGAYSRAEAQEDPLGAHMPSQTLQTHIAQMELQVQVSKLKKLFEKIAEAELDLATVAGETDPDNARPFVEKKQKLIESLRVDSDKTRDQIFHVAKGLPQGYPLQLTSSANQSRSAAPVGGGRPAVVAQKPNSDSQNNSASKQKTAPEVLAVKVEFTKAKLITELLWGVLKTGGNHSVGADERANLIVLRGEKQWIENARKLIETLDRCGSPNINAAESR